MRLFSLAPCLFVLACSSSPASQNFTASGDDSGADAGDEGIAPLTYDSGGLAPNGYPVGPYGSAVGFTLNDFSAEGYRLSPQQTDSSQLPWSSIDVREYNSNPACKCLLVTVGATWCGDCMAEQPMLVMAHAQDPSFCVMGILQADIGGNGMQENATRADVDAWTQMYKQNFFVVQGTDETMQKLVVGHGAGSVALPFSLIVKPDTMKVVGEIDGVNPDAHGYAMSLCQP